MTCVGLLIPVVDGREQLFERAQQSYFDELARWDVDAVVYSTRNAPTCGDAFDVLTRRAVQDDACDYLLYTADDVTGRPGWWQGAERILARRDNTLPHCALHWGESQTLICKDGEDGEVIHGIRGPQLIPTDVAAQIIPIAPLQAFIDSWLWSACRAKGWRAMQCDGFAFDNWNAGAGYRADTVDRMADFFRTLERRGLWSFAHA